MEKEGHFIAVGAFIVLGLAAGIAFLIWLGSSRSDEDTHRYAIDFEGSVAGLDVGNDVRYLGVRVGRVAAISLIPDEPSDIQVLVDIREGTPLTRSTVAELKLQGITGIAFVELRQEAGPDDPIVPSEAPPWPRIRSKKSSLDKFFEALPNLVENLDELVNRGQGLLSDANLENAERIVAHLERTSAALPELSDRLYRVLVETERTLATYRRIGESAEPGTARIVADLEETTRNLSELTRNINRLYQRNDAELDHLLSTGIEQFQDTLLEMEHVIRRLDDLAGRLDRDPSILVHQPARTGVEIAP